jgi:UPF0755 protein
LKNPLVLKPLFLIKMLYKYYIDITNFLPKIFTGKKLCYDSINGGFMWRKLVLICISLLVGTALGSGIYFINGLSPVSSNKENQLFIIGNGVSTRDLAKNLQSKGLIKSSIIFSVYVKIEKFSLKSGRYQLNPGMSLPQIAQKFADGDVEKVKVTFPEGWRLTQMADRLEAKNVISKEGFLKAAEGKEGYLFPDTYIFPTNTPPETIIDMMEQNFKNRTTALNISKDDLVLASIVEREAQTDEDRPKIAGVYLNRIKIGMRLDADPTIQYAKGTWDPILRSDYQNVFSLYNTYLHAGLPPGPICIPGLKSIEAVKNPETSDYFYFFHANGKTYFSKSLEEHNEKVRQFL